MSPIKPNDRVEFVCQGKLNGVQGRVSQVTLSGTLVVEISPADAQRTGKQTKIWATAKHVQRLT